jgi:hypothetical protein
MNLLVKQLEDVTTCDERRPALEPTSASSRNYRYQSLNIE